jgi:hypothetical protein
LARNQYLWLPLSTWRSYCIVGPGPRADEQLHDHGEHPRLERNFPSVMQEATITEIDQEIAAAILGSTHGWSGSKYL